MEHIKLTRRRFAGLAGAAAATRIIDLHGAPLSSTAKLTADEVVKRLSAASGVPLPERTVDGFKSGEEHAVVRGIAVTSMATVEVLRRAVGAKLNLVLSFEPTFFGRNDGQPAPVNARGPGAASLSDDDPILMAKRNLLRSSGLVVYRLYDQWAGREQGEHAKALAQAMGWTHAVGDSATEYQITPARLSEIVAQTRAKLKSSGGLRIIGDPDARIQRVTVLPGTQTIATLVSKLPSTDLVFAGETRDWEGVEYFADAASAGMNKGLITVGKVVSADPGMRACANWIKTVIKELPVQWLPAGEPFWRPA